MICERCQGEVGARRPYKRDLAGALPAKNVCLTCFDELMEVAKAIRDASGVIAWAVVGDEALPPIRMFDGTEELQLAHVDAEVEGWATTVTSIAANWRPAASP